MMATPINNEQGMLPDDLERNQNGGDVGRSHDFGAVAPMQRTDSLSLDPAMFEKLFLNPQTKVSGDLRQRFAVPTPLALVGFGISLTPLACCLMGWRGSDNQKMGVADIGAYFWFGGMLSILAAFLEWLLGNTFAFVVFSGYGSWYLTYGATLTPFYNAAGAYAYTPQSTALLLTEYGSETPGYTASFGFLLVFMTVFSLIMTICSIRVNVPFFILLVAVTLAFAMLSASQFIEGQAITLITRAGIAESEGLNAAADAMLAKGEARLKLTLRLVVGAGASFFAASMLNWFLLLAIMLAVVDFPLGLPVIDLSQVMKSRSEIRRINAAKQREATSLKLQ